ncbi:MAG: inositol monophosphatase, partial [Deltaproteobacteria bacterium]|nr:inositol monophosphatase [Deltaproteobacteria bacterium]
MNLSSADLEDLRRLLCRMQEETRDQLVRTRDANPLEELSRVVEVGLEERDPVLLPEGTAPDSIQLCCIIDPIDGTRSLMYDKRSAWVLSGIAPHPSSRARLCDISIAAMTEIPTAKQRLADQVSAIRGLGPRGIRAERVDLDTKQRRPAGTRPSTATDLRGGFASFARFFPEAKGLLAEFEESLWNRLY